MSAHTLRSTLTSENHTTVYIVYHMYMEVVCL